MFVKIVLRAVAALFVVGTLAACNTMAGAGKDIERTGSAIKNEANERR